MNNIKQDALSFHSLDEEQKDYVLDSLYNQGIEEEALEEYAEKIFSEEVQHLLNKFTSKICIYRGMMLSKSAIDELNSSESVGIHWTIEEMIARKWNPSTNDHPKFGDIRVILKGYVEPNDICIAQTAVNGLVSGYEGEITLKQGITPKELYFEVVE
ncbi:hypothetical protein AB3A98_002762 [Vibrio parahaemolyticus]